MKCGKYVDRRYPVIEQPIRSDSVRSATFIVRAQMVEISAGASILYGDASANICRQPGEGRVVSFLPHLEFYPSSYSKNYLMALLGSSEQK